MAEAEPSVTVTEAHVKSLETLLAKLEKDGKALADINDGNFMLTPNGRVIPIDMGVGDALPMRKADQSKILEKLKALARNRERPR
jgi:hypothetical protein